MLSSVGLFMAALDTLVVATALPVLRVDLHAGLSDLEWTVNAYNLSFACLLLTGAALGERFGRRRVFTIGLGVFTVASAFAALSPSVGALVAARVVQGAGAAIIMPLSLTLISNAFPAEKRGMAIGLWGGISGLAVAAGPVIGGAVIDGISWHWIFWLNVPIGIAIIPMAAKKLTESFGLRAAVDVRGLLLAAGGLFGITWGLVRSNAAGWTNAEILIALVGGGALLVAFYAWERRTNNPMLSPELFRRRGFLAANGVSFFMYAALFGALFLMTQFLETALGYTPFQAGLRILPWTAAPMFVAPIAGSLADRYGNRLFMGIGLSLQAIGFSWVALIAKPGVSYVELCAALVIAGVGISMCFPTVANAVVGVVQPHEIGVASGANSAMRELGGVFGVAVLSAVFVRPGVYTSAHEFAHGMQAAMWVAAVFSVLGVGAAIRAVGRSGERVVVPEPAATEVSLVAGRP